MATLIDEFEVGAWEIDRLSYHSERSADSHSSLDVFRRSVEEYAGVYVHGTLPPEEPTGHMIFGSAFHVACLEPERWSELVAVAPKCDRRTNAGKAASAAFEATSNGKIIISADESKLIQDMLEGMLRNPTVAKLLDSPGKFEQAFRWTDERTGCRLKARPDKLLDCGIIIDPKTCEDPSPEAFAKAVANFGYARQMAMYLDGAKSALGFDGEFLFIAIGKKPPHETVIYELNTKDVGHGRSQNQRILSELSGRIASGDWSGRWCGQVNRLSMPGWAFYQE